MARRRRVVELTAALQFGPAIPERDFAVVRRRAIFECCKWDPQVEDVSTLSPLPLLLSADAWEEIASAAESLAREALAAEGELCARPDLWQKLGIDRAMRGALAGCDRNQSAGAARLMRFDFHLATDGWRISEVNSDVPGGFVEGSGFSRLVAAHVPGARLPGDPAAEYVAAVRRAMKPDGVVALVHATSYSDDRQVMVFLERAFASAGIRAVLVAPTQLRWDSAGNARIECEWHRGPAAAVVRFFPAEWLPNCDRASGWQHFFKGARTPVSNPATAVFSQSKRFPLVWDVLSTRVDAWRRWLPETRDPRDVDWANDDSWVVKPAFGRVGEDVGIRGLRTPKEWAAITKGVKRHPGEWVAQRRFDAVSVDGRYPCLGVFTVDGTVAGIYGRMAKRALVDHASEDMAVLVGDREPRAAEVET